MAFPVLRSFYCCCIWMTQKWSWIGNTVEIAKFYLFISVNLFLNNGELAGNDLVYILIPVSSQPLFFPRCHIPCFSKTERDYFGEGERWADVCPELCGESGFDALKTGDCTLYILSAWFYFKVTSLQHLMFIWRHLQFYYLFECNFRCFIL